MFVSAEHLIQLGVSKATIKRKINSGEWRSLADTRTSQGIHGCHVLLASLPLEYQKDLLSRSAGLNNEGSSPPLLDLSDPTINDQERVLRAALLNILPEERAAWIDEATRVAKIVARFRAIKPKRKFYPGTKTYRFVPEVFELCREAACKSPVILRREPHRAEPPAPHTLDRWMRRYAVAGLLFYIPSAPSKNPQKIDKRCAVMSRGAQEWVRSEWRKFKSARYLFDALKRIAREKGWTIPSYSWFYRLWKRMPEIVKTFHLEGESAYVAKYAPFVPRDYSDLQALQVLCGDHSERDVTVLLNDGTLVRPWLTLWLDLRTWLIWGWYLDTVPSSHTIGMAYADGVRNFGAQPLSRPDDEYYNYVYTDHGRPYKSHYLDGTVLKVHEEAMSIDGGLRLLLTERKVGILEDFAVKHLLANLRNAKEKPVERVHRDISDWEENTLPEFCGRDAKSRPDKWRRLYAQHVQFQKGQREASPFRSIDEYREQLAIFITRHNTSTHERSTLGGRSVIPLDEYRRLYTTRYEVSEETLALLMMKPVKRVIGKDGVYCFQKHWFYYQEAMAEFKGMSVEVRYTDDDYSQVWVVLPNGEICKAPLIPPTSIINPNKKTLKAVKDARAYERKLIQEFDVLRGAQLRCETVEERTMSSLGPQAGRGSGQAEYEQHPKQAIVHKLTRIDRKRHGLTVSQRGASVEEVANAKTDDAIFSTAVRSRVSEFYGDESE